MKVCLITHYIPSYRTSFLKRLSDYPKIELNIFADHENVLFNNFDFIKNEEFNYNYSKVREFKVFNQYFYLQLDIIKLLIKGDFDSFIFMATKSDLTVWIGLFLAKIFRRKVILWGHFKINTIFDRFFNVLFLRLSTANVFYSNYELEHFSQLIKVKSFVAMNTMTVACDLAVDRPLGNSMIFTGRLLKGKKLNVLLRALSIVKMRFDFKLILVGDGPEKERLSDLARELNLVDYIDFKGAIYDTDFVSGLYGDSLFSVIPSHAGLAIHHAFGNARIVLTDNDISEQPPEYHMIKNGVNGFIYDSYNYKDLADLIIYCFENKDMVLDMGASAKRSFENEYGIDKMLDGFILALNYKKYDK